MPTMKLSLLSVARPLVGAVLSAFLVQHLPPVQAQPVGIPELGDASAAVLSPMVERKIGEVIMSDASRDPSYIDDPELGQYLTDMGRRLASHLSLTHPVQVFPVNDSSINAFAMPGGFIGIHTGLVAAAQTESELAGVVAHEIGHVSQRHIARGLVQQKQDSLIMMAALLAAMVAARGSSQAPEAALAFGQAMALDSQLGFSREAEREADRTGYQLLEAAGYDVQGMPDFFGRMMRATGANERTSSAFLRTHPLSIQRMSDMQNRSRGASVKPASDSPDFHLVKAKMRVMQARDGRAVMGMANLWEKNAESLQGWEQVAAYYGAAYGWLRQRDAQKAEALLQQAVSGVRRHPMLSTLAVEIALLKGDTDEAIRVAQQAVASWPDRQGPAFAYVNSLQRAQRHQEAVRFLETLTHGEVDEPRYYRMLAESHAALKHDVPERVNMGEYYARVGALPAAIEQFQQARTLSKDFYQQSTLDARLSMLRRQMQQDRDLLRPFER